MGSHQQTNGCHEYQEVSRRRFLGLTAGAFAAAALPGWLPRVVLAASDDGSRDVLVSIFLRGGADGLTLCVPHGDPAYYALRPTLAVPRPGDGAHAALDLDGFFGLPPAMAPLAEAWQDGALLVVHACGLTDATRSHFNAMFFMEVGMPQPPASVATGWLGRHLATTAPRSSDALLRAVSIGYGLPRTLAGAPATVPVEDLAAVGFGGDPATLAGRRQALAAMYAAVPDPLRTAAANTARTVDLLERIDFGSYRPAGGAAYPDDKFGHALKSTAALVKAGVGVEAAAIDFDGWDTHEAQRPVDGTMAFLMRSLAEGLAAFHRDLFTSGHRNVVAVVHTEFGRNAAENASGGTDHGHGSLMMLLGGHVAGGRVLGRWPGLAADRLFEGQDLEITTDYRDVLAEVVTRRLGNPDVRNVFPDPSYVPTLHGVTR